MALKYLSPSSINTYLRCPRKFFLKYIRKQREKPSIHLFLGSAVHEALANFVDQDSTPDSTLEEQESKLIKYFNDAWMKREPSCRSVESSQRTRRNFYDNGITMLLGWLTRYRQATSSKTTLTKVELRLYSKKHGVMGIVDVVYKKDNHTYLADYKTGKKDIVTEDIKNQMAIYALLYQENFKIRPDAVSIIFLKTGRTRKFKVTNKLIDQARKLCKSIHKKTASLEEKDYPCQCGGYCDRDFYSVSLAH